MSSSVAIIHGLAASNRSSVCEASQLDWAFGNGDLAFERSATMRCAATAQQGFYTKIYIIKLNIAVMKSAKLQQSSSRAFRCAVHLHLNLNNTLFPQNRPFRARP
eukprot:2470481-Pleurochrysis_carterae.AAC.3